MYRFYTTNCPRCKALKMALDKKECDYETIDLTKPEFSGMEEDLVAKGFMSAPLLEKDGVIMNFADAMRELK